MWNTRLDESQSGVKTARRNINNLRYADDTTLVAESEEETKSLSMKVREKSEKTDFKLNMGFFDSSVGKEFPCNEGDPGSVTGWGRFTEEGIGYPLQYSWASLVAQLAKNLPAIRETWVQSLHWEDPLEKGKATYSGIFAWEFHGLCSPMGSQTVRHSWVTFVQNQH